jgi:hypothetical protein
MFSAPIVPRTLISTKIRISSYNSLYYAPFTERPSLVMVAAECDARYQVGTLDPCEVSMLLLGNSV